MQAERVSLDEAIAARRAHLRPTAVPNPGDAHPQCAHFAAREDGRVVAIASIQPAPSPTGVAMRAWQLRGVATDASLRQRGHGRAVVDACLAHARAGGATMVWCHGRVSAIRFYERLGFRAESEVYEIPVTGSHRVLVKWLRTPPRLRA